MKFLRFGMVADTSDQQSSASAKTMVGTMARLGWLAEAYRATNTACAMASAATLSPLVSKELEVQ